MSTSTVNLNAELYRQLGYVADDKASMKNILDYVKGVVAKRNKEKAEEERAKKRILDDFSESLRDLKDALDGKEDRFTSWEDFKHELQAEGYFD